MAARSDIIDFSFDMLVLSKGLKHQYEIEEKRQKALAQKQRNKRGR
jgi:hypothetical protein